MNNNAETQKKLYQFLLRTYQNNSETFLGKFKALPVEKKAQAMVTYMSSGYITLLNYGFTDTTTLITFIDDAVELLKEFPELQESIKEIPDFITLKEKANNTSNE